MVNDENFDKQAKAAENVKMSVTDASQTERRTKMERVKMDNNEVSTVYTLNTWTDEIKKKARSLLESGYWVRFTSLCIGHTLAQMVEADGIEWARQEYGDRLITAKRDGWGDVYCRLS